jgi:hypothetical protein
MEETLDKNFDTDGNVTLDTEANQHLIEASKWANFLAIVGFVMLGLMLLGSLFMIGAASSYGGFYGGGSPIVAGIVYLGMIALYFFPTYYLYLFAKKIKSGINSSSEITVTQAFGYLKSMFKFMGILTIVIISIYILFFLLFFVVAAASGF